MLFDFDSARVRADAAPVLQVLADALQASPPAQPVRVDGHTDGFGTDAYNQDLSVRRATAVASWLGGHGVTASLAPQGFGETRPIAPETVDGHDDPAGRQLNGAWSSCCPARPPPETTPGCAGRVAPVKGPSAGVDLFSRAVLDTSGRGTGMAVRQDHGRAVVAAVRDWYLHGDVVDRARRLFFLVAIGSTLLTAAVAEVDTGAGRLVVLAAVVVLIASWTHGTCAPRRGPAPTSSTRSTPSRSRPSSPRSPTRPPSSASSSGPCGSARSTARVAPRCCGASTTSRP